MKNHQSLLPFSAECLTYPCSNYKTTSSGMATVFYVKLYDRFILIKSNFKRNKLHKMKQGSNFLIFSFNNKQNVRATIQSRREKQSQYLTKWFSIKNTLINIHINSTWFIREVKWIYLGFSSIEIKSRSHT